MARDRQVSAVTFEIDILADYGASLGVFLKRQLCIIVLTASILMAFVVHLVTWRGEVTLEIVDFRWKKGRG